MRVRAECDGQTLLGNLAATLRLYPHPSPDRVRGRLFLRRGKSRRFEVAVPDGEHQWQQRITQFWVLRHGVKVCKVPTMLWIRGGGFRDDASGDERR